MENNKKQLRVDTYERWFDERGNEVKYKNSEGLEVVREYNDNNKVIHVNDNKFGDIWYEYNDKGKLIREQDSHGVTLHEYDGNDRLIRTIYPSGKELIKKYDDDGNNIYLKSEHQEIIRKYDDKHRIIESSSKHISPYINKSYSYNYIQEYDDHDNKVHYKDSKGFENIRDIEYYDNNQIKYIKSTNIYNPNEGYFDPDDFEYDNSDINNFTTVKECIEALNHMVEIVEDSDSETANRIDLIASAICRITDTKMTD